VPPIRIERPDEAAFRAQGNVDDENPAVMGLDAGMGIVLATSGEGTLPGYARREKLALGKRLGLWSSAFGQPEASERNVYSARHSEVTKRS